MNFTFWLSLLAFLGSAATLIEIARGLRKLRHLNDSAPAPRENCPDISIVLAALDEADTIEPALRSVLALDYARLEIIAVNDRSTDATGEILERLALEQPKLRVLHVRELPAGWLGKNHALFQGAQLAGGDYLLFTDADVVFQPSVIARAAAHCELNRLDHLAVFPSVPVTEPLLAMLLLMFKGALLSRYKPWKAPHSPRHFLGIGAFNMVRASVYRKAGGHGAIPLAVLDDIVLGRLMKQHGGRQEILNGSGAIAVEWYRSTRQLIRGVRKNAFASLDYSMAKLLGATALLLLVRFWPWIGLLATDGAAWWLNLAAILAALAFYLDLLRDTGWSRWCLAFMPVSSLVAIYALWNGSLSALLGGGIEWRGTRYSLDELRRAHR